MTNEPKFKKGDQVVIYAFNGFKFGVVDLLLKAQEMEFKGTGQDKDAGFIYLVRLCYTQENILVFENWISSEEHWHKIFNKESELEPCT